MARAPSGTTEGLGSRPTHNTSLKRDPPTQNGEKNTGKTQEQARKDPQAFDFSLLFFFGVAREIHPFSLLGTSEYQGKYINKIDAKTGTNRALLYEN